MNPSHADQSTPGQPLGGADQPLRVHFKTLGCKVNLYDTHAMQAALDGQSARTVIGGEADVLVLNSCAVTHEAWSEARQIIRRFKRENPQGRVVLTGCYAQIQPAEAGALAEVDAVLGTRDRGRLTEILADMRQAASADVSPLQRVEVSDVMAERVVEDLSTGLSFGRTRGVIRVQTGCNYRCTFCVIPYARGNSVSVPMNQVLEEAARLVAAGHGELVPVGIHVADYGKDLTPRTDLMTLLKALLAVPGLQRLRLSSIDPHEVDDELIDLVCHHPKMARHLHVAVQSMAAPVLKAMKRRHGAGEFTTMAEKVAAQNPRVCIGTDLLAGFPTESPQDHEATLTRLRDLPLAYAHVFPYSPRPGTPAAALKPLPGNIIKARARSLRDTSEAKRTTFAASLTGHDLQVLIETRDKSTGRLQGLSSEYIRVLFPENFHAPQGALVTTRCTSHANGRLFAD